MRISQNRKGLLAAGLAVLIALWPVIGAGRAEAASGEEALWAALREGSAFALMRHALAPGTGDPANFAVDDCTTQRNLSEEGRRQAVSIGARFRDNGIARAGVFSSAWCRCLDTAELLALGPVTTLPALNSFFEYWERREPQTTALREWLAGASGGAATVLVTHQVNITALTGVFPRSGEIVVVRLETGGEVTVLGRL